MNTENRIANALIKGMMIYGLGLSKLKWQEAFIKNGLANIKKHQGDLDIAGIPWSIDEFESQKEFLTQVIKSTINAKAWNNFRYVIEDEAAEKEALKLLSSLNEFGIEQVRGDQEVALGIVYHCDIHPWYYYNRGAKTNCVICDSREPNSQEPTFLYKRIDFATKFRYGKSYRILPEIEMNSKEDVFKLLDKFCDEVKLISLGNMWTEIDLQTAKKMLKNGLTYDLAYKSSKFSEDKIIEQNYTRLTSDFWESHLICCLSNSVGDPWGVSSSSYQITHKWTFAIAYIFAFKEEVLFSLFFCED